jgi:Fe-S-cluster containining protein
MSTPPTHHSILAAVQSVYDRIGSDQNAFLQCLASRDICLDCPQNCGRCCEGFTPDISGAEASYLAAWLLERLPPDIDTDDLDAIAHALGRVSLTPAKPGTCPFHDADRLGGNCLVYPARASLCRLFGFSAVHDRNGDPAFALCRHMPDPSAQDRADASSLAQDSNIPAWLQGCGIPRMADYGWQLRTLDPAQAEARLLTEILPEELRRISLRRRFSLLELDPDDAGPNAA